MGAMGWHAKSTFVPLWVGAASPAGASSSSQSGQRLPKPSSIPHPRLPLSRVSPDAKAQDMSSINHSF